MSEGGPPSLPTQNDSRRWSKSTCRGVFALLAIHSLLLGWLAAVHSPTYDEPGHLAAGYRIWTTGEVDLYVVNPPLVKTVAAWPLLFFQPQVDWSLVYELPGYRPEFDVGNVLLWKNPKTWYWMLLTARWACIPLSLLGAVVAFQWSRELFGKTAGWIALVLWTFDPNILGNGCLVTPDVGASSMGLLTAYLYWKWLEVPAWDRAALAGISLGLAMLAKSTMLIFGPLWIGVWLARRLWEGATLSVWRQQILQLGMLLIVGVYVLNMGYGFSGTGTKLKEYRFITRTLGGELREGQPYANRFFSAGIGELPVPLPRQFVIGLDLQKRDFENGRWAYLAGEWRWGGWPYFYLAAIAIKSPLGYGGLAILAIAVILRAERSARRAGLFWIGLIVALIGVVSLEQGFTSFVRYVLPALPFAIMLMSAVGHWVDGGGRPSRWVVGGLLGWVIGSSTWCLPHSLSYFNELIGGPENGRFYLYDANIDWGQDLYFVKDWIERHPEARPVTLTWNGIFDPQLVDLNLPRTPSPPFEPGGQTWPKADSSFAGWHIVNVTSLHSADMRFAYLRDLEPVDRIGYSVMVYHLTEEQAAKARTRISPSLMPPKRF